MKKANRFTALLVCIAMVTVMFAACSGNMLRLCRRCQGRIRSLPFPLKTASLRNA